MENTHNNIDTTVVNTDKKATVKAVNKKLKELGAKEILISGKNGFYFTGGLSRNWPESGVYMSRIGDISVDEWVEVYYHLSNPVTIERVVEIEPAPIKKVVVKETTKIRPGTVVKAKKGVKTRILPGRENNRKAKVLTMIPSMGEGAVYLDRDLRGCRYWNLADLEVLQGDGIGDRKGEKKVTPISNTTIPVQTQTTSMLEDIQNL